MSHPKTPPPAKLVIGMLLKQKELVYDLAGTLTDLFGDVDAVSPWLDFNFTDYYSKEMGRPLYRRMFSFKKLIDQRELAQIKVQTNKLEQRYAQKDCRRVNLDPGYLLLERFVLATGKNFTHRIYLDQGIYADLTLIYQKGEFRSLPWTYPDYAHPKLQSYLIQVRNRYSEELKQIGTP